MLDTLTTACLIPAPAVTNAADVLKEYLKLKEDEKRIAIAIEAAKAAIEALRENGTVYPGTFRNVKGRFVIVHVEEKLGKRQVLIGDMESAVETGLISPEAFATLVSRQNPAIYNKVKFEPI